MTDSKKPRGDAKAQGATPKFVKPRGVPYALKEKIEEDLKRLKH